MDDMKKTVVITDMRSAEAKEAYAYLTDLGYDVVSVPEDICLCDEEALNAFAEPIKDTLVGVIHPAPPAVQKSIMDITIEDWDKAAYDGPIAALIVTKVFCQILRDKGYGSMIYMNSIFAEKPMGKGYLFSLGCGAVEMLSKEAGQDYACDGVNVFFVQRGITENDPDGKTDVTGIFCGVDLRYPQRKIPKSDYLNGLLAFLLTPAAMPLSGSPITADGGFQGYYTHRKRVEGRPYFERKK